MGSRNCSLDLRLAPFSTSLSSSVYSLQNNMADPSKLFITHQERKSSGQGPFVSNCDATELQARTILWLASQEVKERISSVQSRPPSLHSQLYGHSGLSLKRSLQRFLQKRKKRAQGSYPYNQH
ncbi:hypothetical protein Tsubulata_030902 [Turnera subulata]|uniref:Protein TIFY 5A n=1 Tax=Turnera subulata TaxID=218843 RepID=A0A9Q0F5R6_9ROSI|nr:hypothetical protein Tsubulata_030902 [Turnera subulata]